MVGVKPNLKGRGWGRKKRRKRDQGPQSEVQKADREITGKAARRKGSIF